MALLLLSLYRGNDHCPLCIHRQALFFVPCMEPVSCMDFRTHSASSLKRHQRKRCGSKRCFLSAGCCSFRMRCTSLQILFICRIQAWYRFGSMPHCSSPHHLQDWHWHFLPCSTQSNSFENTSAKEM